MNGKCLILHRIRTLPTASLTGCWPALSPRMSLPPKSP
jgi:hypothetical protein